MRSLWASDDVEFRGEFVNYDGVSMNPKPHGASVPIHIGGHTKLAARRAGVLGDGFFPGTGNVPELFDIARQTAADAGRDPLAIEMTVSHPGLFGSDPAAAIDEAESWGAHRLTIPAFFFAKDPLSVHDSLPLYMAKLTNA